MLSVSSSEIVMADITLYNRKLFVFMLNTLGDFLFLRYKAIFLQDLDDHNLHMTSK